ncbi:MAG: hypothetical protein KatS3mg115_1653 [Candidatus Poribacteria bacterium]|nr:MAG: hypothetical protein KatS3mg115_1653 [Candidatus Poribacteria bacterium]
MLINNTRVTVPKMAGKNAALSVGLARFVEEKLAHLGEGDSSSLPKVQHVGAVETNDAIGGKLDPLAVYRFQLQADALPLSKESF